MRREAGTDLWVARQLDSCGIEYTPQGSDVKDISMALAAASKRGTGRAGYPEYVAVVGDYVLVIEDKADLDRHVWYDRALFSERIEAWANGPVAPELYRLHKGKFDIDSRELTKGGIRRL